MSRTGILQVVNGEGEFNEEAVNAFIKQHNINDVGVGYQIVAITGPQSSGKSTLMNTLVRLAPSLAWIDDKVFVLLTETAMIV